MIKKAFLFSLGCKINRCEIESITEKLKEFRFEVTKSVTDAHVIIVNTCAVTKKSANRCKQALRKFIRANPDAFVIVTGCLAQYRQDELREIEGVDLILGNLEKEDFSIFFKRQYDGEKNPFPISYVNEQYIENNYSFSDEIISEFHGRTRPFVKIQDGCEQFCAYCVIPYLRGKYRSRDEENIIKQVDHYSRSGYKEVVLTGVHVGKYGWEYQQSLLTDLLKRLLKQTGIPRIRLSSIEPNEVNDELIDLMANHPRLCSHLHVPLQSGSDCILKKMKRRYTTKEYEDLILKLYERIPLIGVGMDVITGFPGETEELFMETYRFIKELPPLYLHVFSYSDREPAEASRMTPKVDAKTIQERSSRLIALSKYKRREFYNRFVGKEMTVLVENKPNQNGISHGLTSNYIRVFFKNDADHSNRFVDVTIDYVNEKEQVTGSVH